MINLILVRHGDCDGEGLYIGRGSDMALTEIGKKQIGLIAGSLSSELGLKSVDALYASPMLRTMESALIISDQFNIPVQPVPGWEEIDFGEWEGNSYNQLMKGFAQEFSQWIDNPIENRPPGGESLFELKDRVLKAFPFSMIPDKNDIDERNIIIVSHRGPIAIIILELLELGLERFWNFTINRGSKSRVNLYPRFNELNYLNLTAVP